jgi:hypothetical protein
MKKRFLLFVLVMLLVVPVAAFGADKLIVQDGSSVTQFVVTDAGKIGVGMSAPAYMGDFSGASVSKSQLHFSLAGADNGGYITSVAANNFYLSSGIVYDGPSGGWVQKATSGKSVIAGSGDTGYKIYTMTGATPGSVTTINKRFEVTIDGYVGVGGTPGAHLFQVGGSSGAYTDGTTWVTGSSREIKENINELSTVDANETLKKLNPVTYNYKVNKNQGHVGFIAEDVPELVATTDRKGLSAMDIVAVLTKVVQDKSQTIEKQQTTLDLMAAKLEKMEAEIKWLKSKDYTAQK